MARPVYMIGLDAYDHVLMKRWMEAGLLPNLARLSERSARWKLRSSTEVLQGSIWPTFATACDPSKHGMYFVYQVKPGSYDLKRVRANNMQVPPFWIGLHQSGYRTVVLDVPKVGLFRSDGDVQIVEYGAMDHYSSFSAYPEGLARETLRKHGDHVLRRPFRKPMTREQYASLLRELRQGARRKHELGKELIARHKPDFFVSVFGESHAAGHHFWSEADQRDAQVSDLIPGDALKEIYVELDKIVGEFVDQHADTSNIFIFSGHGMARDDRPHWILRDVLSRLGLLVRSSSEAVTPKEMPATVENPGVLKRVDIALRSLIKRYLPSSITDRIHLKLQQDTAIDFDRTVAWPLPTDHQGFIRINLKGREPRGVVEPKDYERVVDEIVTRLEGLVNVETGNSVAEKIYKLHSLYEGGGHLDMLPDIAVAWRNEPVNEIYDPQVGRFQVASKPWRIRPGNHRLEGFCFAIGPDIEGRGECGEADLMDLGPSALVLLGVPLPKGIGGVPLKGLKQR